MSEIIIETERLFLRTQKDGDIAQMDMHCNTSAVMEHLGGVQDAAANAAGFGRMAKCQSDHGHSFWIMEHKESGDFLGFCGIKRVNDEAASFQGDFEAGWRLRGDYWRQGIAYEAATASIDYAFGTLNAPHVVAMTVTGNVGSWGMMEKLGMQRRADLDFFDPEYSPTMGDIIVYSITADQWKART